MKTFKRICIKDAVFQNGEKKLELKRGQEYITGAEENNGHVFVMTQYWAFVPADLFAGAVPGPGDPHQ